MTGYADPDPDIYFVVHGVAVPKGSKSAFALRKAGAFTGRAIVVDDTTKGLKVWTSQIDEVVQRLAAEGCSMLDGPIVADVRFYFSRPKSHPKSRRTWPQGRPDLGKALRALEDRMIGVLIRDDSRIVRFTNLLKDYAEYTEDPRPRAEVRLWEIERFLVPEEASA